MSKNGVAVLGRDAILAVTPAVELPCQRVRVPEWGGVVLIREMSAFERDQWEISTQASGANVRGSLLALCIVDENGQRLFTQEGDALALAAKGATGVDRIFDIACTINGIGTKDLEELEGN